MPPLESSPAGRFTMLTLTALVFTLLVWSCVAELDVVVTTRGRVTSEGNSQPIQAPVSASISRLQVREGDAVHSGQVLAQLDAAAITSDVAAAQERVAQTQAELARLQEERTGRTLNGESNADDRLGAQRELRLARQRVYEQRRREYTALLASKRSALEAGRTALLGVQHRLSIAQEKVERAKPYVDVAMPRFQFLQLRDDQAFLERELQVQQQNNVRLDLEIEEARQKLLQVASERDSEIAAEIADRQTRLAEQTAMLEKLRKQLSDTIIRSPIDGLVQRAIASRPGSAITYGETLFEVVPVDAPLIVEVEIPNADMGFLHVGQIVDIKLDAFPFQRYGRIAGRLAWISPDAEKSDSSGTGTMNAPSYFYRGKVHPQIGSALRLSPGMTTQVDIVTDRRRVIDFFLFPLRKTIEEGMAVR